MRAALYLLICLAASQVAHAQNEVLSIIFNSEDGEYVIQYRRVEEQSVREGYYVPGNLVRPTVRTAVKHDSATGGYNYSYTLSNGPQAGQPIYAFSLIVPLKAQDVQGPTQEWTSRYIEWQGVSRWTQIEGDVLGVPPGASLEGFSFRSAGLPTITNAYASGLSGRFFPDEEEGLIGEVASAVDSLMQRNEQVEVLSIGPKEPPFPFEVLPFLETIRSYGEKALELGWIANRGILQSLQAKLDNAERQLQRGNTPTALNVLRAFVNEVEALPENQLSSEAYALLKYNAEYLIQQLEAQ